MLDDIFISKDEKMLYLLPYAIVLVYAMKGGGKFMQVYYSAYIGLDIIRKVRDRLLESMLRLDISFFHSFRSGELISRNVNDVERIRHVVSSMIPEAIREALSVVGLLVVVIYQSPKLAFFALVVVPVMIIPLRMIAKKLKKISHKSQEKTSDITSRLSEIFSNIEMIKASVSEKYESKRFNKENESFFKLNLKSVRTGELSGPLMETMGAFGIAVVIIVGGKEVIDENMSVGAFFSFLTALFMLYTPIKRIMGIYNQIQDAVAASERILFIFDQEPKIISNKNLPMPVHVQSLRFENVRLKYGENEALKGVSFEALRGKKVALVGDSGGGKSAIVNLIPRFFDVSGGRLLVDGVGIEEFNLDSLRNSISMVTQRIYIFNDTIANNVAYAKEVDKERVLKALKDANALDFVEQMGGVDVVLDEFGVNLSGGQRQRIAIARALYNDPQILIFDEATSALDSVSEQRITDAIERASLDRITIIIAHRLTTIKDADLIVVLKHGKVVDMGDEKYLLESCEEHKKLSSRMNS